MVSCHQKGIKVRTLLLRVTLLMPLIPRYIGFERTNRTLSSIRRRFTSAQLLQQAKLMLINPNSALAGLLSLRKREY